MAPLYHGTDLEAAESILRFDKIYANTMQFIRTDKEVNKKDKSYTLFDVHKEGVSLTRSLKFARWFKGSGVVFELDQQKIINHNKIIPYSYWSQGGKLPGRVPEKTVRHEFRPNEYEEFALGTIKNIDDKIIKLILTLQGAFDVLDYVQKRYPRVSSHPKLYVNGKFVNQT